MSIENITANILNDAKNTAENTLKNAEQTAEDIINSAKREAEAVKNKGAEIAIKDAENLKERRASAAELQGRKMILSAKQEAINKSFNVALELLKSMKAEKYIDFLVSQIVAIPNCEGTIILNKADRGKIGEELVNTVNKKLNGKGVTLSNETHSADGGFVLRRGNISINSTFETILDSVKDELTGEIVSALFK